MSAKKTLTSAEVAERLGFHPNTIQAMVRRGDFDGVAYRFGQGRRLRFDAEKFEAWVEKHVVGAPEVDAA